MNSIYRQIQRLFLIVGDALILYVSLWLVVVIRYSIDGYWPFFVDHLLPFTYLFIVWFFVFYLFGLYETTTSRDTPALIAVAIRAMAVNVLLGVLFFYLIPYYDLTPKTNLMLVSILVFLLTIGWRKFFFEKVNMKLAGADRVVILGDVEMGEVIKKIIRSKNGLSYKIVANINADKKGLEKIERLVSKSSIDLIIFADNLQTRKNIIKKLYDFIPRVSSEYLSNFYEDITYKVPIDTVEYLWFIQQVQVNSRAIYEKAKRLMDIVTAIFFGLAALIFLVPIAIYIAFFDRGPIFYTQKRVGRDGTIFDVIKFRSMKHGSEKGVAQWAGESDSRITPMGKVIRKTSIDELPQFINILKGEMSAIGPRPERPEFVKELRKKIPHYNIRHIVKPGLTGWAQINYRYGASVEDAIEKLQYDLYYIKNRSTIFDLRILLKTLGLYLRSERSKLAR